MRNIYLSCIGLFALYSSASAYEFVVPVNSSRQIDFNAGIHEDCTSIGETITRVTIPPEHGTVVIISGRNYPNFPQTNRRYVCNSQKVNASQVWYTPRKGYIGPDSVSIDVIYGDGGSKQKTIPIQVR